MTTTRFTNGLNPVAIKITAPAFGFTNSSYIGEYPNKFNYHIRPTGQILTKQLTNNANIGGQRGVLPCRGIWTGTDAGSRILKKNIIPYQGGIYPHQGYARHQKKGLAYLTERPLNLPLLQIADNFNSGLNSKLGQPK